MVRGVYGRLFLSRSLCAGAVLAIVAGVSVGLPVSSAGAVALDSRAPERVEQAIRAAEGLSDAFEYAAETIRPSLVSIVTEREVRTRQMMPGDPFGMGSPFRDFFGRDFFGGEDPFGRFEQRGPGGRSEPREAPPQVRRGQGSGFVVSPDGFILTNHHVIDGAQRVLVRLHDDREWTAEVVGSDPQTDVAVIRIEASGLVPVSMGDSERIRVGQWVLAAGSPFGLRSTITAGIISATGRMGVGLTDYEDFIQTDAAINPGNSGGPLINLRGEVIGMNTAIATRSGAHDGVGFAIPINMAQRVMNGLIDSGAVVRGYLGVNIQDLSEGLARSFGHESADGVLVSQVQPGSPAEKAGIRNDDIVLSFNGRAVRNASELRLRVAETDPGTTARVVVLRDGQRRDLQVEVGKLSEEVARAVGADGRSREIEEDTLGVTVAAVTPEIARRFNAPADIEGVAVVNMNPTGLGARTGLQVGDIIQAVGRHNVKTVDELRDALRETDMTAGIRLTVRRGGSRIVLFMQDRR